LIESVSGFGTWLRKFIFSWKPYMEIPKTYGNIVISAIAFLISLFMYSFILKKFFFPAVLVLSMSVFIVQWTFVREVSRTDFYITIAALVFLYFIAVYIARTRKHIRRGEKHRFLDMSSFMATAAPVVVILMILTLVIPKSSEPIKWKWLDDRIKYRDVGADKPVDFKSYDSFSLAATGFSDQTGRLGGSVTLTCLICWMYTVQNQSI
jgi:hypothetical protein